jgi:hypothetical protein
MMIYNYHGCFLRFLGHPKSISFENCPFKSTPSSGVALQETSTAGAAWRATVPGTAAGGAGASWSFASRHVEGEP